MEQIIAPYEEITYNYTVSDVSVKNGSDGMIGVNINGGNGNLGILWNNGEDSIVIENLSAGVYAFTVTDESDCEKISEDIHVNEANLNSVLITPEKSCFVYPNPSSGFISISCDEIKKYTLFDSFGRCIMEAYYNVDFIDISRFDNGIYWLCLKGSDDEFLEVLPIYLNY